MAFPVALPRTYVKEIDNEKMITCFGLHPVKYTCELKVKASNENERKEEEEPT
jgi:hypothetical protein